MTITGIQVAAIATDSAKYLSMLAAVSAVAFPALAAEYVAAAAAATALAANTSECDSIAATVNTLGQAVTAVWDYLSGGGHANAAIALAAQH